VYEKEILKCIWICQIDHLLSKKYQKGIYNCIAYFIEFLFYFLFTFVRIFQQRFNLGTKIVLNHASA